MLSAIKTSTDIIDGLYKDSRVIRPLYYKLKGYSNCFEKELEFVPRPTFDHNLFPFQLQMEYLEDAVTSGNYVLSSKIRHGIHCVFTRIKPTIFEDWYSGHVPIFRGDKPIKTPILIEFSPDYLMFRIYLVETPFPEEKMNDQQVNELARMYKSTSMKF